MTPPKHPPYLFFFLAHPLGDTLVINASNYIDHLKKSTTDSSVWYPLTQILGAFRLTFNQWVAENELHPRDIRANIPILETTRSDLEISGPPKIVPIPEVVAQVVALATQWSILQGNRITYVDEQLDWVRKLQAK